MILILLIVSPILMSCHSSKVSHKKLKVIDFLFIDHFYRSFKEKEKGKKREGKMRKKEK